MAKTRSLVAVRDIELLITVKANNSTRFLSFAEHHLVNSKRTPTVIRIEQHSRDENDRQSLS